MKRIIFVLISVGLFLCLAAQASSMAVFLQNAGDNAGNGGERLYFVYDNTEKYGRYYDAEGTPSRDMQLRL